MIRRLLDSPWLYFALAALLVVAGLVSMIEIRRDGRPKGSVADLATLRERDDVSVVFILIDTLRADRLSSYGYSRPTSPVIDELAASGIRFAHNTAQSSWTKTSMASLWTGTYPASNGILRSQHGVPPEATMPAEIFRDAGFRTAGIWRNGWVAANFGFDQGFEIYVRPIPGATPERMAQRTASSLKIPGTDEDIYEGAREFLNGVRNERFFLYLHYMDVHQYVYDDSANFGPTYSDIYDNSIRWVDRNVAGLVAALQDLRLMERTIIVIAADHGEAFREHGIEGHAKNLHAEVIDTPLILSLPFRLDPGVVVHDRVENVDIFPTILDLLGLPPLPGAQGVSLVPAIQAAAAAGPGAPPGGERRNHAGRTSFAHLDRTWGTPEAEPSPLVAVTDGPWRYFHYARFPDRAQLFDHRSDPGEQRNLVAEQPEIGDSLRAKAEEYLALPGAVWGRPAEVQLDRLRLEQLRALGYEVGTDDPQRPAPGKDLRDLKRAPEDGGPAVPGAESPGAPAAPPGA